MTARKCTVSEIKAVILSVITTSGEPLKKAIVMERVFEQIAPLQSSVSQITHSLSLLLAETKISVVQGQNKGNRLYKRKDDQLLKPSFAIPSFRLTPMQFICLSLGAPVTIKLYH